MNQDQSQNNDNNKISFSTETGQKVEDLTLNPMDETSNSPSSLSFDSTSSCSYEHAPFSSAEISHCSDDTLSKCRFQSHYNNHRPSLFNQSFLLEDSKPMSSTTNFIIIHDDNDISHEMKKEDFQPFSNDVTHEMKKEDFQPISNDISHEMKKEDFKPISNDISHEMKKEDFQPFSNDISHEMKKEDFQPFSNDSNGNSNDSPIIIDDSSSTTPTNESQIASSIFGINSTSSMSDSMNDDSLSKCWFQSQYGSLEHSLFDPLAVSESENSLRTTNSFMMNIPNNDILQEVKEEDTQSYSSHLSDDNNENLISIDESSCTSPTNELQISSMSFCNNFPPPPNDNSPSVDSCNHSSVSNVDDSLLDCSYQYQDNISWTSLFDQFTLSENSKPIQNTENILTNNDDGIRYHEVKKEDCSNNSDEPIDGDPNYSTSPSPLTITPITNPIIFDIPSYECPCHHTHYLENPLIRGYFHTQDEVPSSNSNPIRIQINNWFVQGKIKKL